MQIKKVDQHETKKEHHQVRVKQLLSVCVRVFVSTLCINRFYNTGNKRGGRLIVVTSIVDKGKMRSKLT